MCQAPNTLLTHAQTARAAVGWIAFESSAWRRSRLGVSAPRRRLPLSAECHIPVDAPRLQFGQVLLVAVDRIRQYRLRVFPVGRLHCIQLGDLLALITHIRRRLRRDDQLILSVYRHLRVVALLKPLRPRVHDSALRTREVVLRFRVRLPVGSLVPRSTLWIPICSGFRPRASSAGRCAASIRSIEFGLDRSTEHNQGLTLSNQPGKLPIEWSN